MAGVAYAATSYQVNNGDTVTISEHADCAIVTNNHVSGLALFVPTGTPAEWAAFRASPGAGITAGSCDITPDAFNFTPDVTNAALNTLTTATAVTISGINTGASVSVSGGGSPQISINGGAWGTSGTITNGQTLAVRLTSSETGNTSFVVSVTVGTETDNWTVTTATGANCTFVGETVGGGKCVTVGANALVAAISDEGQYIWETDGLQRTTGATSTTDGLQNTNSLASYGSVHVAALACYNSVASGYADWYLPSSGELQQLYSNKGVLGGFSNSPNYWSSSEESAVRAWSINFTNSGMPYRNKINNYRVRCVRRI